MRLVVKIPFVIAVMMTTLLLLKEARAARILMAQPIGTRSHKNFYMAIAENLVQRNHTVTLVTGYKSSRQRPNIREVFVPDINIIDTIPNLFETNTVQMTLQILPSLITSCSQALSTSDVQALLKEEFDLMMVYIYMTDCFLSIVHKLKVPFIYLSPNEVQGANSDIAGTPFFPSLRSSFTLDLDYPLTFGGRIASALTQILEVIFNDWYYIPRLEKDCRTRQLCPEDMPSIMKLRLNSSLFITNSVGTLENPTLPYSPTVVHAGGIHCRPAQPLPEDLHQWVTGAGKPGFILFSLGTLIKSSTLPENYRKVLLDVFGSLQQRVLWKWDEDTMEGLPSNVRLSKWLPQQDLLGHSQLQLFITHGGLLSTQEATYHGVPVLGIPVAVDQHKNMRMVQREGWGDFLSWKDLTYENLRSYILQVMDDSRMRAEVQRRSRVMRDQPMSPGDWTTYWVEYVLRHQGAPHLRSSAVHMPWYQLYNVDVWALVVVVTLAAATLVSWLFYKILECLVGCFSRAMKTKKD